MNAIRVRKRLDLRGSDEQDLERRVEMFRRTLQARSGSILHIKWNGRAEEPAHSASIVYHVPLDGVRLDVPE